MKPTIFTLFCALTLVPWLAAQENPGQGPSVDEVFQGAHFDRWAHEGPRQDVRWTVRALSRGLSVHQRMVAHLEAEIPGSELAKRAKDGRLVTLVQVEDESGQQSRDYGFIELKGVTADIRKQAVIVSWDAFALPGRYKVTLGLYDGASGEHNLAHASLRVPALKDDGFAEIWQGLPNWEFWAPLTEPADTVYRPDIESRLHLKLATRSPLQIVVLADLTASDEFYGSSDLYSSFLALAVPLVKDLSQIEIENGSLSVVAVDLRKRKVTFEQDHVQTLDWARLKTALAAQDTLGTVAVKALQHKAAPDFLREELLRRLPATREGSAAPLGPRAPSGPARPFRVFILVGGSMSSYAFPHFPPIAAAQAENCVVYHLQYDAPWTTGASGEVKKMLAPLAIRTFKVRSAESVRQALRTILNELGRM